MNHYEYTNNQVVEHWLVLKKNLDLNVIPIK